MADALAVHFLDGAPGAPVRCTLANDGSQGGFTTYTNGIASLMVEDAIAQNVIA